MEEPKKISRQALERKALEIVRRAKPEVTGKKRDKEVRIALFDLQARHQLLGYEIE
ncbi:MAG TPA: hypothetical protein VFP46_02755 [Candidatus Paceibacterota bacterium]|nr:hypothetical protein [Candidatus Paceibacterota bacterium]